MIATRIIDVRQGTPEWIEARLGLPTASNFDKIVTPTDKPSASSRLYLGRLAAEWYLGEPIEDEAARSQFMERGTAMEAEAVAFYEFDTGMEAKSVGLCFSEDGRAGASPDRLVGDDGLLEIKCPGAATQMAYLLGDVGNEYRLQLQGQLWVTGRAWVDLLCYNPVLPRVKVRAERDEQFIALLSAEVGKFCDRLDEAKAKLEREHGPRVKRQPVPVDEDYVF